MSERLCQILSLKRRAINVPISGIGQVEARARFKVNATVSSRVYDFSIGMDFLVLQRVISELPSANLPVAHWKIPKDIQLADPNFNSSNQVDLLIGAEHFYRFLFEREIKRMKLGPGLPMLINSVFSVEKKPLWSREEQDFERHFVKTFSRTEDGRYVVRLPKHVNFEQMLGNSREMSLSRFRKQESQLERKPDMRLQYNAFMQEYLDLEHMKEISEDVIQKEVSSESTKKEYYLPHRAVLKESSTTTKVRIVFDGSACTDTGYSLNDALLKGPIIQDELPSLLIRSVSMKLH
ncbi:uncharacterized protein LOC134206529 [Armigeres subalbatus]|uniref:uncharacterized protein LOC134206529 n=1 Tax=Armigeres subalbatus TaxID=124917 RepID=UPI002ED154C0